MRGRRERITSDLQLVERARAYGFAVGTPWLGDGCCWFQHADLLGGVPVPAGWSRDRILAVLVGLAMEIAARRRGGRFVRGCSSRDLRDLVEDLDQHGSFVTSSPAHWGAA